MSPKRSLSVSFFLDLSLNYLASSFPRRFLIYFLFCCPLPSPAKSSLRVALSMVYSLRQVSSLQVSVSFLGSIFRFCLFILTLLLKRTGTTASARSRRCSRLPFAPLFESRKTPHQNHTESKKRGPRKTWYFAQSIEYNKSTKRLERRD